MKYGIILPFGTAREVADAARAAEQAGWDGIFVGEAVWHMDVWVALTAAAMQTHTIRLGTMIAQVPRYKPWKLASETATLDNLSNGRVILGAGVGIWYYGYQAFHDEITDRKVRAELMDECVAVMTLLQQGEPFNYNGKHYHIELTALDAQYYPPRPIQQPRVPIWMVGVWPRQKSMRRVLQCDGLIPTKILPDGQGAPVTQADLAEMKAFVQANRSPDQPFDITSEGKTVGMSRQERADSFGAWETAGATWWLETLYGESKEQIMQRLNEGPLG
ncbi:MAG: LLM class flavin-dependent oxidoreductase [Anaerolineae bacterium]|nr:LLM class flavin-dependent oxidoreductase [Anaerolineae bacterium]